MKAAVPSKGGRFFAGYFGRVRRNRTSQTWSDGSDMVRRVGGGVGVGGG